MNKRIIITMMLLIALPIVLAEWVGETSFTMPADTVLEIDLTSHFTGTNTYLATSASNLTVELNETTLKVIPDLGFGGERKITVYADNGTMTEQEITIIVERSLIEETIQSEMNESEENITEENTTIVPEENETIPEENLTPEVNISEEINITPENLSQEIIPENITQEINASEETNITGMQFDENEKIIIENKTLGKKTEDELEYEVYFTNITQTNETFYAEFHHDYNIPLPVFIEGNVSYNLSNTTAQPNETIQLIVQLTEGILPEFSLHVGITSEVFEFGKKIPHIKMKKKGMHRLIDRDDEKIDVEISNNNSIAVIHGINVSEINTALDSVEDEIIKTEVFAAEPIEMENATIALKKTGKVTSLVECTDINVNTLSCPSGWIKAEIPFIDDGENITFTVNHFSGYAGADITVITVQSYPTVGGNWTVLFNTTGVANLTIKAFNGTTWSDSNESEDLRFLSLKCGENALNYTWVNDSVFVPEYNCSLNSYETSKVITSGVHNLQFTFGDDTAYAFNDATVAQITSTNLTQGLVGKWSCENNFKDTSGQGNPGTQVGGVTTIRGIKGRACSLDGINDIINVTDSSGGLNIRGNITISAWIKTSGSNAYSAVVSKYNLSLGYAGYIFDLATSKQMRCDIMAQATYGTGVGPTVVTDGAWHHVVCTYNGSQIIVYTDGVAGAPVGFVGGLGSSVNNPLYIGQDPYSVSGYRLWNGSIDEVRVYNRTLSTSEILALYNTTKSYKIVLKTTPTQGILNESGLVGYWKFNREDGSNSTIIIDSSGQGNTGTVTGAIFTNEGRFKEGYRLDAVSDAILVTQADSINMPLAPAFTVSTWIKPAQLNALQRIISIGQLEAGTPQKGWELELSGLNSFNFMVNNQTGAVSVIAQASATTSCGGSCLGKWTNLVGVWNKTQADIYVNGVYIASSLAVPQLFNYSTTNGIYIGTRNGYTVGFQGFNGSMDEIRLYNRSLSASEVAAIYNGTKSNKISIKTTPTKGLLNESGLVGYWKMDEVITTGRELLLDSNMEKAGTTDWTASAGGSFVKQATGAIEGTQFMNISGTGTAYFGMTPAVQMIVTGHTYRFTGYYRGDGTVNPRLDDGEGSTIATGTSSSSWQAFDVTKSVVGGNLYLRAGALTTGNVGFDNVKVREVVPGVADSSSQDNDGSLNATFTNEGKFNGGYKFDGVNDNINVGASISLNITPNITVSMWIKPNDLTTRQGLYFANTGLGLEFNKIGGTACTGCLGTINPGLATTSSTASGVIGPANTWHHVAYVKTNVASAMNKIYVNGVEVSSYAINSDWTVTTAGPNHIGSRLGASEFFNGTIDEVRIYNRALTASEVGGLYNGTKSNKITLSDIPG